jgi:hypothetical protein
MVVTMVSPGAISAHRLWAKRTDASADCIIGVGFDGLKFGIEGAEVEQGLLE